MCTLEYMPLPDLEAVFYTIPANIRVMIEKEAANAFGDGFTLKEIFGFMKEEMPQGNLRFVSGAMLEEIEAAMSLLTMYETSSGVPPAKLKEVEFLLEDNLLHWKIDMGSYYNYETKEWKRQSRPGGGTNPGDPLTPKERAQTKRELRREIRSAIRERDKKSLKDAREKFIRLINAKDEQAELAEPLIAAEKLILQEAISAVDRQIEPLNQDIERIKELKPATRELRDTAWQNYNLATSNPMIPMEKTAAEYRRDFNAFVAELMNYDRQIEEIENQISPMLAAKQQFELDIQTLTSEGTPEIDHAVEQEIQRQRASARRNLANTSYSRHLANDLSDYERAVKDYKETNMGAKLNKFIGAVLIEAVESLYGFTPMANLFDFLKQFPIPDIVVNILEGLLKPCPNPPLQYPPPNKFLNSLKIDLCDPTMQITWPEIYLPPIDWKYYKTKEFRNKLKKVLEKMFQELLVAVLKKIINWLEDAICKALETIGKTVGIPQAQGETGLSFMDALEQAFCPENADQIPSALFQNQAQQAVNLISGLASTEEILQALTEDGTNEFNNRIYQGVKTLAPELEVLFSFIYLSG